MNVKPTRSDGPKVEPWPLREVQKLVKVAKPPIQVAFLFSIAGGVHQLPSVGEIRPSFEVLSINFPCMVAGLLMLTHAWQTHAGRDGLQ